MKEKMLCLYFLFIGVFYGLHIFFYCSELPPDFKGDMKDVTVAKEQSAAFQVELTKGDARARWFKNGNFFLLPTLHNFYICMKGYMYNIDIKNSH